MRGLNMKNRAKLSITALILTMTTLTGCGLGNMVFHFPNNGNSSAYDIESPELQNKFLTRPKDESKPSDYVGDNIVDNLYIAAGVLKDTLYWSSEASGKAIASVGPIPYNQDVYSKRIINNDENHEWFFQTNTISAFVKKSEQRFGNSNSYLNRQGSNPSLEGATYSKDNIIAFSKKDYLEQYGNTSNGLCNYVLNDYSVTSGSIIDTQDGLYTFKYTLNPEYASAKYIREVKYMSGSTDYPTFTKSELEIVIDDNWVLKSIKTTDVYSISILGGLVCSSELSEDFSYSDSYQVIPEKEDFKAKFGMVDNNITIEKTALDYLTDAAEPFIASDGTPINIQGDFNVNDSSLPIYVSCDLANKDIKISFDDSLNIYYKNEMAYLLCGENLNFAVKKDEVMNLIKHYNSNFSESGIDFSSLLESDFVSSLMENMVMSKDENNITISLSKDGLLADIHLVVDENDKASFDYIELSYLKDKNNIHGNIKLFTPSHTFKKLPDNLHEFTNLNGLADSIDIFVDKKAFEGTISYELSQNVAISGDYKFDFKDKNNAHGFANLKLKVKDEIIPIGFNLSKNYLVLKLSDNEFKMTIDEFKNLLFNIISKSGLDLDDAIDGISSFKLDLKKLKEELIPTLNNLFSEIVTSNEKISISLDLMQYKIDDELNLEYLFGNSQFNVSFGNKGKLTLVPTDNFDFELENKEYISFEKLNSLINMGMDFFSVRKFETNFKYTKEDNSISGTALIDLNKNRIQGNVDFSLKNISGTAGFYYENNEIYFNLSDKIKTKLTKEEAIDLVNKLKSLLEKYDISFNINTSEFNVSINEILNSLNSADDEVKLYIPFISAETKLLPLENKIVVCNQNIEATILLKRNLNFDFNKNEDYLDFGNIDCLISEIDEIVSGVKNFSFKFTGKIDEKEITVNGFYVVEDNNIYLSAELENIKISLNVEEGIFYLNINDAKIKGSLNSITIFLDAFLKANNIDIPFVNVLLEMVQNNNFDLKVFFQELSKLSSGQKVDLKDLINEIKFADEIFDLKFTLNEKDIDVVWNLKNNLLNLNYDNNSLEYAYGLNNEYVHVTDESSYFDTTSLDNLKTSTILNFADLLSRKSYRIEGSFNVSIKDSDLEIKVLESYLNFENGLEADINVELIDKTSSTYLTLKIKDNKVYICLGNGVYFSDTVDNLLLKLKEEFESKDLDVNIILDKFNSIFNNLEADEDHFAIDLNLDFLNKDFLNDIKIVFDDKKSNLSVVLDNIGSISLTSANKKDFIIEDRDYHDLDELSSFINGIKDLIDNKKYSIEFEGKYDKYDISGTVNFDLNNKFDFEVKGLNIYCSDFNILINVSKIGDYFYIDLGNVKYVLTIDELFQILQEVEVAFDLDYKNLDLDILKEGFILLTNGDFTFGIEKINSVFKNRSESNDISLSSINFADIINSIYWSSDLKMSADFSSVLPVIGKIDFSISTDKIEVSSMDIIRKVSLTKTNANITDILVDDSWARKEDLSNIIKSLKNVINFLNNKTFSFNANGIVKEKGESNFNYNAEVKLDINDVKNIKLMAKANVADIKNNLEYNVELTIVDNVIYVTYNSNLKFYISVKETLQLVRYVTDIMGIKSDLLSSILDSVTEGIDTGVFTPSIPEMKPLGLNINELIKSLSSVESIKVILDAEKLYEAISDFNPNLDSEGNKIEGATNSYINASISTSSNFVSGISVTNIYSKKDEIFDININFDDIYSENNESSEISSPQSLDGYYDFNSITTLFKTFFNSANIKSYSLNAKVALDLIGYKLGSIPVNIDIQLDDNMVPKVSLFVDVKEEVKALGGIVVAVRKGKIWIYYDGVNKTIYLKRYSEYWWTKKTEYRTYTTDELANDPNKLIDFIYTTLYCSDTIKNALSDAILNGDSSFELCDPIHFENVLKKYEYDSSEDASYNYSMIIDGPSLVKSNLDDINLNFGFLISTYFEDNKEIKKEYLDRIAVSTKIMGIIGIDLTEGKLTNVHSDSKPSDIIVEFPDFSQDKW